MESPHSSSPPGLPRPDGDFSPKSSLHRGKLGGGETREDLFWLANRVPAGTSPAENMQPIRERHSVQPSKNHTRASRQGTTARSCGRLRTMLVAALQLLGIPLRATSASSRVA